MLLYLTTLIMKLEVQHFCMLYICEILKLLEVCCEYFKLKIIVQDIQLSL